MPRIVAAKEAKNKLGEMFAWVEMHQDEVIVENRGEPKAVIMSYVEYEHLTHLKEQARRQDALARLEKLRTRVQSRNPDLTEVQAEALADRFSRDLIGGLMAEGKVTYEGN